MGRHGDWFECGWVVIEWLRMASLFDFVMVDLTKFDGSSWFKYTGWNTYNIS